MENIKASMIKRDVDIYDIMIQLGIDCSKLESFREADETANMKESEEGIGCPV